MTTAAAADELAITIKKKAGSAVTNWSADDHTSAPTTGDKVQVMSSPNLDRQTEKIENEAMGGETAQSNIVNGAVQAKDFSTEQELYYDDLAGHLGFAMTMGTSAGSPTTPGGATLTRNQVYTPALNIHGLVATICQGPTASQAANQPSASICPSASPRGFTIEGSDGGVIKCTTDWSGIDVFRKPAPTDDPLDSDITLTAAEASIAAATLSATGRRVSMRDLQVYIDDEDGATDFSVAGGQTYVVQVSSFSLRFERDTDFPQHGSQAANAPDGVSRPMLPVNNKQRVVPTLTLQVPRWENDNWFGRSAQNVKQRIRLEFTGDLIEAGFNQRFRVDLPSVNLMDADPSRDGNIEQTLNGNCYQAASTPTGFSSADYCRIEVRNLKTTDALA